MFRTTVLGFALVSSTVVGCVATLDNDEDEPPPSFGAGGSESSGAGAQGGGGAEDIVINEGFIGGPCTSDADCRYEGGFCLTEDKGLPGGMCSLDCSLLCPDQDGAVSTFCVEPGRLGTTAAEGLCTTRCDYGQSPTGCRTGYQCQVSGRYSEPDTEVYTCVPGTDAPFELSACHQELLSLGVAFSPAINPMASPEGHPELVCDVEDPVWLTPYLHGVSFRPASLDNEPETMFSACPHAVALVDTAALLSEAEVSDLVHYGIYNCRVIAGSSNLSEHAFANAIDIAGLNTAGGVFYTVLDDYEKATPNPTTAGGQLLRSFAETLFEDEIFNIILTPDYNDDHADHFHCDLTPGESFFQ
jgi:hypothetical protein